MILLKHQKMLILYFILQLNWDITYNSPLAYIKTNVEGTYNVLESSKNNNIEQTIISSTVRLWKRTVSSNG